MHEFGGFLLEVAHGNESEIENESEEDDGAYGNAAFDNDTFDDIEFSAPTPRERRTTSKKNWITPRLCAALDKAKVKKIRLKK